MHRLVDGLARILAVLGGTVLTVLIVMTCLSIAGRSINSMLHSDFVEGLAPGIAGWLLALGVGPINGDFELVEAGMAFAIFAFLPLCQLNGAHAKVDVFTSLLPERVMRVLNTVIELVFAIVLIIIAFQLFQGTVSKRATGQTTFLLEFPIWWSYAASVVAAIAAAAVAAYVALMRVVELITGTTLLPPDMEADH